MRKVTFAALLSTTAWAAPKKAVERDLGFGGGLFTAFPPMVTVDAGWRLSRWLTASLVGGYLKAPIGEFDGSSTYFGLEARSFFVGAGWFGSLALGHRTFEITTRNDVSVGEVTTEVAWTRRVSQQIAYPAVGWASYDKAGDSLIVAAGVVVPFGTKFSMTHDPDRVPGLSAANLATEEASREADVKNVTNKAWPSITVKYVHFFDWLR